MFSVVMPIFNKRHFVADAIASVLAQSHQDFELILVDDGSTDGSYEAAAALCDGRTTLVSQPNSGVGAARNLGVRLATREWVAFLDSDDLWFECHLEEISRVIDQLPDSALVATSYVAGRDFDPDVSLGQHSIRALDYFREAVGCIGIVWTGAAAARRGALEAVGGFPLVRSGEDLACWAALALHFPVGYSERPTAFYRSVTGGIMDQSDHLPVRVDRPASLAEVSASVAYLVDQEDRINDRRRRADVRAYIASRIEAAVRSEYAVANFERGKRWAAIGHQYARHFAMLTRILLMAPDWLLRPVWSARRALRRGFR